MYKLCLNSRDEMLIIDLQKLACLQASGNYTQVLYIGSKGPLVGIGLSKIEEYLKRAWPADRPSPMIRLGRSLIINQSYVSRVNVIAQKLELSDCQGHVINLEAPKPILKQYKDILSRRNGRAEKTESVAQVTADEK